jgi:6-phosphogluconolactonase
MHPSRVLKLFAGLVAAASLIPAEANADFKHHFKSSDTVYTLSNEPNGNRVLAFDQRSNGRLAAGAEYPTGGLGTGAGLGNQGALASDGDFSVCSESG